MDQPQPDPNEALPELEDVVRPRWSAGKVAGVTFALGGAAAVFVHLGGEGPERDGAMHHEVRVVEAGEIDDFVERHMDAAPDGASASPSRHRGEEGKMGRPSPKNRSDGYGMKGTEIGEAYGVGGLGLVGTGRGGGGTGESTIGGGTQRYAASVEQYFILAAKDARSTFSVDVDTAAYSNMRRIVQGGSLPPAAAVRIEEYVNYFEYDYDAPTGDVPFSVDAEVGPCPWAPEHKLVHVGLQGKVIEQGAVPPRNLVFLVDVSGSMAQPDKLPLLVSALELLVDQLRPEDRVGLVVYAGASGVVLDPTSGAHRQEIKDALGRLQGGGSTNGGAGIELAYRLAQAHFVEGGINRVVLATDGDFNVGLDSDAELQKLIEAKRDSGVFLSVLGFGSGFDDATMELLADKGNGNYAYIDTVREAQKVLGTEVGGTLVTIAKDVKIQVEFDPDAVFSWRLVGYDNRRLAHQDFVDDTKDAGEIGAGHTVTALYEIVPNEAARRPSGEVMRVALRYKDPDGAQSKPLEFSVGDRDVPLAATSDDFRFAAAVTEFGLIVGESKLAGKASWGQVIELAAGARGDDEGCLRGEFVQLVEAAAKLAGKVVEHHETCES